MAATGKKNGKTVVVALGGNAILQPGQVGTFEEQLFNIDGAMRRIAQLVEEGWRVVLTHGNGPQVGNLLIQNALAVQDGGADADGRLRRREPGPDRLHGRADPGQPPAQAQARRAGGDDRHPGGRRPQGQGLRQPVQAGRPLLLRGRGPEDDARGGPRHARGRRQGLAARRAVPRAQGDRRARGGARPLRGRRPRHLLGRRRRAGGAQPRRPLRHRRGDRQGPRRGAARQRARRRGAAHPHRRAPGLRALRHPRAGGARPASPPARCAPTPPPATSRPARWAPRSRPACASSTPAARA